MFIREIRGSSVFVRSKELQVAQCVRFGQIRSEAFHPMANLILKNVCKAARAEGAAALRDLNLEVRDREFFVLTGPSSAELSAVLRAVAGLDPISRGEIAIGDRPVQELPPNDRAVAMVFRSYALFPHLTVSGNLALGLHGRGFPKAEIEKRVKQAAALLGLESLLKTKSPALSGTERLRVALARGVIRQPKVCLLDDPLAGIESTQQAAARTELLQIQHRLQATTLCATTDAADAMALGDRVAVFKDGSIQQVDTPAKLYAAPVNLFVAGFMGAPKINLIQGKLRTLQSGLSFREAEGGTLEIPLSERDDLKTWVGKDVILGVRPEHLRIASNGEKAPGIRIQALVDAVEFLGAETLCTLGTGAHTLISRSFAVLDRAEAGHRMAFTLDASKALLFDPETAQRL